MHKITLQSLINFKFSLFSLLLFVTYQNWANIHYDENFTSPVSSKTKNLKTDNQSCDGENQIIIKDDFGMGESNWGPQPSLSNFNTTYKFTQSSEIAPGEYSLLKTPIIGHPMWWNSGRDHTGENNGNGYMLLFNANSIPGTIFYEKKYSKLCTGSFCTFSIYASNIFTPTYNGYSVKPKIKIELVNPSDGRILQSIASDELEIGKTNELLWKEICISFTISEGMSDVLVRVINAQSDPNPFGNDLALDDASFSICVPEVTLSLSNEVRVGESTMISAINHNTTSIEYDYQWQQWDGNEWKDIPGATSLQYKTPILNQDVLYRIRYAQKGIDITNNNNLICSGSKDMNFQLPSPQSFTCPTVTLQPVDPIIDQCSSIPVEAQLSAGDYKILDTKWTLPLSPHSSLSNTSSLTPILTGISEGYDEYKLVVKTISNQNLIINGDFELGYANFSSNYIYKSGIGPTVLWGAGTFTVANNPKSVHQNFPVMGDHTNGIGKMLIVNGAEQANVKVWSQTIHGVKPHTKYAFSAFLASVSPDNLSILSFSINGRQEGSSLTGGVVGDWNQFYTEWDSGELNGDITIDIVNQQSGNGGNDFALDDLSFAELCETTSILKTTIKSSLTLTSGNEKTICSNSSASFTALGSPRCYYLLVRCNRYSFAL